MCNLIWHGCSVPAVYPLLSTTFQVSTWVWRVKYCVVLDEIRSYNWYKKKNKQQQSIICCSFVEGEEGVESFVRSSETTFSEDRGLYLSAVAGQKIYSRNVETVCLSPSPSIQLTVYVDACCPWHDNFRLYEWKGGVTMTFKTRGGSLRVGKRHQRLRQWKETDGFFGPCYWASSLRWDDRSIFRGQPLTHFAEIRRRMGIPQTLLSNQWHTWLMSHHSRDVSEGITSSNNHVTGHSSELSTVMKVMTLIYIHIHIREF